MLIVDIMIGIYWTIMYILQNIIREHDTNTYLILLIIKSHLPTDDMSNYRKQS
jgi:hypothetical protein